MAKEKLNLQRAIENLRLSSSSEKNEKKQLNKCQSKNQFQVLKNIKITDNSEFKNFDNISPFNEKLEAITFGDKDHSVDFAADFKNLEKLDSDRLQDDVNQSLNLGSAYSNNEYQFDDKVSSVQRDLSLDNCTDEYNSILNSSDMSNAENNDRIGALGNNRVGGLTRDKTKAKLGGLGSHGMARVKSSVKLFTVEKSPQGSYDSESFSDLSTGDSAYPVLAFKQRVVKEFEPKVSINYMNMQQSSMVGWMNRVPTHTKLKYEPPMKSK